MRSLFRAVASVAMVVGICTGVSGTLPMVSAANAQDAKALLSVQPTDRVMGDANAPITMIEYASMTCPHCARFSNTVLPDIEKKWIATGKVKLVYRDYSLDGVAMKAAQLAKCAPKERYFAVVEMMYREQANWAKAQDPIADLSKSLNGAGMNEEQVKACLANEKVADNVVADRHGGEQVGVKTTPTIFVNGEMFKGERTIEEFDALFTRLAK